MRLLPFLSRLLSVLLCCSLLNISVFGQQRLDAFDPVLSVDQWSIGATFTMQHLGLSYVGPAVSHYGETREVFEFKPRGAGNNFELGLMVQRKNSQHFGWETGLQIGSSSTRFDFEQNVYDPLRGRRESNFAYDLNYHRIKLPFLFQAHVANSPRILIEAGAFASYNFATTGEIEVTSHYWEGPHSPVWTNSETYSPEDYTLLGNPAKLDWGFVAGIGLDFPIDYYQSVGLGFRFEKSMDPLYEPYEISAYRMGVTASYRFLPN